MRYTGRAWTWESASWYIAGGEGGLQVERGSERRAERIKERSLSRTGRLFRVPAVT